MKSKNSKSESRLEFSLLFLRIQARPLSFVFICRFEKICSLVSYPPTSLCRLTHDHAWRGMVFVHAEIAKVGIAQCTMMYIVLELGRGIFHFSAPVIQ